MIGRVLHDSFLEPFRETGSAGRTWTTHTMSFEKIPASPLVVFRQPDQFRTQRCRVAFPLRDRFCFWWPVVAHTRMESRSVHPMLFQESPARSSIVVGDPGEFFAQLGRVSLFPNDFKCLRWPHQRFPIPSHSPYLQSPYTQLGPKKKREIATFPATFFWPLLI